MSESLKLYVQKITKLPTIPIIAQEILNLVDNDLISVSKLEKIVENDPAISAKILSVANSAFFGLKEPTSTLSNAIMRVGFSSVRNIALGISLMTVLGDEKKKKVFDYQRIFNHSVSVGFVASLLCKHLKLDIAEEVLMHGMLHDIGYLVLNRYFFESYLKVLNTFEQGNSILEAEKTVLDFTHAEIGNWLAEKWKLPAAILDTTIYHHTPSLAKNNFKLVAITHIADYLTTKNILGPFEKDPDYPFDYSSLDALGISENRLKDLEEKLAGNSFFQ
jgi:putative nucleotidyltransferase with HDIG domain